MENTIDIPMKNVRDIKTITAEIITLTRQAQKMILNYAIEVGRRLCEAKSMLPHGQWGAYLAQEVEFSQSTANNFMKIFEEYGAEQMTLDGAVAKSQTLGNLTYSKALKLLAVPAEEREDFVKKHDVEAMSSRQLEQAIRERDEAKARLTDVINEKNALQTDLDAASKAVSEIEKQSKDAVAEWKRKLEEAQKAESAAKNAASQAQKELERLKKQPVSEDAIAKIKDETKAELEKERAAEEMKRKALEEAAKSAQREAERAASEVATLRKQLQLASVDATAFKVHFEQLQEGYNKLHGTFLKIEAADPEQAAKLKRAVLAVLESFQKRMEG